MKTTDAAKRILELDKGGLLSSHPWVETDDAIQVAAAYLEAVELLELAQETAEAIIEKTDMLPSQERIGNIAIASMLKVRIEAFLKIHGGEDAD